MLYTAQVERMYLNGRPIPTIPEPGPARRTLTLGPFAISIMMYAWRGPS
jgi:hypothetical protein